MADARTAVAAQPARRTPLSSATALPWSAWFAAVSLVVLSTTNTAVLVVALVSTYAAAALVGGPRRGLAATTTGAALLLGATWMVLGVVLHRDGAGGDVLWVLPSWTPQSGGSFGGVVTTAQLHLALVRALQAAAMVAMLGLLAQAVPASGWLRLNDLLWGRAAPMVGPLLCLGEVHAERRRDRVASLVSGLALDSPGTRLAGLTDEARARAAQWAVVHDHPRPRWRAVVGLLSLTTVATGWAVAAISGTYGGLELTIAAAGVLTVIGAVLHPAALPRPTSADLAPAVGAAAVLAAWLGRDLTGDGDLLDPVLGAAPALPVAALLALAVLPLLLVLGREQP